MADLVCGSSLVVLCLYYLGKNSSYCTCACGASLLILLGIISQHEAIQYIDFNTIGLLFWHDGYCGYNSKVAFLNTLPSRRLIQRRRSPQKLWWFSVSSLQ